MGYKNEHVDVDAVLAARFEAGRFEWTERDVLLYALGVGAGQGPAGHAVSDECLRYCYENHDAFAPLPTFGVVFPSGSLMQLMSADGIKFNPMMLLHGEHDLTVHRPLPASGTVTNHTCVREIWDKGKGALLVLETESRLEDDGKPLVTNRFGLFIRGIGGFGGPRGPATPPPSAKPPSRAPDASVSTPTTEDQALLYRLSGDMNPLHADPAMAKMGRFPKPILHGLCTYGIAGRAIAKAFGATVRRLSVRFSKSVFPGETITTDMWREGGRVVFVARVGDRVVLSNAYAELEGGSKL